MRKNHIVFILLLISPLWSNAQLFSFFGEKEKPPELLMDRGIQIETTKAINNMYNFNFREAELEFKWIMVKYPKHPIGHFLLGLNDWWRIVPDTKVDIYDNEIHANMDKAIDLAVDMYDAYDEKSKEAAFFAAAAYAFKGRLYAERENWIKAAWAGKKALNYLEKSRGDSNINPELLFGDGLYNFYSKWIQENYKSLRPLLTFFRKGDKNLGIKQLENVSQNAFYTRMEARYFLVQIYSLDGKNRSALIMSRMMHAIYPNNSFFHRYAARSAFVTNQMTEAEQYANEIMASINTNQYGYGANEGRYATYILGYINQHYKRNIAEAKSNYLACVKFAESNDSEESGYYQSSLLALGDFEKNDQNYQKAEEYYKMVLAAKTKKSSTYAKAKERISELKKLNKKRKK